MNLLNHSSDIYSDTAFREDFQWIYVYLRNLWKFGDKLGESEDALLYENSIRGKFASKAFQEFWYLRAWNHFFSLPKRYGRNPAGEIFQ